MRDHDVIRHRHGNHLPCLVHTEGFLALSHAQNPPFALVPESADSRLLVDLISHASDLSEASHALQMALEAGEGEALWFPLTMHAVTAYVRPFILSKVRPRLDHMPEFPGIPSELLSIRETIRKYRNTTVAHSQSDLTMPIAVALLDGQGRVRDVQGWTLMHPMPGIVAEDFDLLIGAMETIVNKATKPVTDRLRKLFGDESPEAIAAWPQLELLAARDNDFQGARQRTRAPRFTSYWRIDSSVVKDNVPGSSMESPSDQ